MPSSPELKDVPISAMVEQRLRDEIAEIAKRNERSFSAEVRLALRLHVLANGGKKCDQFHSWRGRD